MGIDILKEKAEEADENRAFDNAGFGQDDDELIEAVASLPDSDVRVAEKDDSKLIILSDYYRDIAYNASLVPKYYKDSRFDTMRIKSNLAEQHKATKQRYIIRRFGQYAGICHSILSTLRAGKLPEASYIIGAPAGFGKASFANECIMTALQAGYRVVPYISLMELADIGLSAENRLINRYRIEDSGVDDVKYNKNRVPVDINEDVKRPEEITSKFSYYEYLNSDILFVTFSAVKYRSIESMELYNVVTQRARKGKATIAMMASSINVYTKETIDREFVWDEILAGEDEKPTYKRMQHVSTYKRPRTEVSSAELSRVDSDTGVVE